MVKIRLSDGQIIQTYGEYGSTTGKFMYPTYLGISENTLYVVDSGNGRLVKLNIGQNPAVWSKDPLQVDIYMVYMPILLAEAFWRLMV